MLGGTDNRISPSRPRRTAGLIETPIATLDDATACIREIVARGLMWHFEDDPAETIVAATGAPAFTAWEADTLRARVAEMYAIPAERWAECGGCPIGYAMSVEEDAGPLGRCDTCGAPCDDDGCTADRTHEAAC